MNILETQSPRGRRFWIDGRPAPRQRIEAIKATHRLECFRTETDGDIVRQFCSARPR